MFAAKKWRLGLLLLIAWGGWVVPVHGQTAARKKPPDLFPGMTSRWLRDLGSQLELSESQKQQLLQLKKEFQKQHQAELKRLRQETQRTRQAMQAARLSKDTVALQSGRASIKELRQAAVKLNAEFEKKMLTILNEEQKQRYAALKKNRRRPPAANSGQ